MKSTTAKKLKTPKQRVKWLDKVFADADKVKIPKGAGRINVVAVTRPQPQ